MNWGHLIWAVVVGAVLTSAVIVMGTFGLVSRPLSDFAVLLYLRLALGSGALYLVFNRVSFRRGRVVARGPSEPDRGFARSVAISTERDRSLLHQRRVGSYIHGRREDLEEVRRHDHLSQVNVREESGKLPFVSHLRTLWNPATEVVRLRSTADRGERC